MPGFLSSSDIFLSLYPSDHPFKTNRDIKLMGVELYSYCNPGVTSNANIYGAVAEDKVENFTQD